MHVTLKKKKLDETDKKKKKEGKKRSLSENSRALVSIESTHPRKRGSVVTTTTGGGGESRVRVFVERTPNETRLRPKRRCIATLCSSFREGNVYQPVSCMELPRVDISWHGARGDGWTRGGCCRGWEGVATVHGVHR